MPHLFGVDKAQEGNIKDIKVTHRSEGPNINWEYLKKLHPAIHVICAVTQHVEEEFGTLSRGKSHTRPKKEKDLQHLHSSYHTSGHHNTVEGRDIQSSGDCWDDYTLQGALKVIQGKVLPKWAEGRTYEQGTRECWDSEESDEGEGETNYGPSEGSGGAMEVDN